MIGYQAIQNLVAMLKKGWAMTQTETLPHWQLSSIFPDLESQEFAKAKAELKSKVEHLDALISEHDIRAQSEPLITKNTLETFEVLINRFNEAYTLYSDIRAYLFGFVATDAFNDRAQAELSSLQPLGGTLSILDKLFTAWLGSLDVETLINESAPAKEHSYLLRRRKIEATHLMGDEAEALASKLNPSGGQAWGKLHGDLISRGTIRKTLPGKEEADYPLTDLKNLQADESSEMRKAAYEAELELLNQNAVSYAAALNSIKGQVNELSIKRGWSNALEASLFQNGISEKSLLAMQQACQESFPIFRRYLLAKAKFLGKDRLAWYDLNAPVSVGSSRGYSWAEAKSFVVDKFSNYSDNLASFAQKSFDENWHDVPPRKGKRNGAFCMSLPGVKESRVMLNFGGKLDDLFTIAHELGHAYHNHCHYQAGRSILQSVTPRTLAETASIFCETIVTNAILAEASEAEQLAILEQDLLGSTQLVIDIHSRFIFESGMFEKRLERELSIEELNALMLEAQAATYGEALDAEAHHPYMWAHKGHYYSSGYSFYNYPYTFGYLFGLGLYSRYQQEASGFHERYDELLASTGMGDAASLAGQFGIDLEDPEFWRGSLSIAAQRVATFETLVEKHSP